jgi:hypothetical protein
LHLHAPRHYTFQQTATILGRAIGRPQLRHHRSEPAEGLAAMLEAGLSADAAEQMSEMARWLSDGTSTDLPGPVEVMTTTLEDFAGRFRRAYESLPTVA